MDFRETLKNEAKKLDICLNDRKLSDFYIYKEMLKEKNKTINLTSIIDDHGILYKHFLDSLTLTRFIEKSDAYCIDVGTGAGFPMLPIKIVSENLKITLLDSVNKKVGFLKDVSKTLDLSDVECIHSRAEDLAGNSEHRGKYDYAVSRAVALLDVLIEYCLPFLKVGGIMLAMKSDISDEITNIDTALKELKASTIETFEFDICYDNETYKRTIVKIVKNGPTVDKYPRKAGIVKKNPL